MKILGINFGHDASVAYLENGSIQFAIEEEKASRVKQDFGFPKFAISELFKRSGLSPGDIDIIAYGGHIYQQIGANEIKYRFTKDKSYKNREIIDRITSYINLKKKNVSAENKNIFQDQAFAMGYIQSKPTFYDHHLAHAASAYYCAPFESDLVITCDGFGDSDAFNFYAPTDEKRLTCLHKNSFECSIGQFYSEITRLLGFRPTRHEGKITGLAAYGKPTPLLDEFRELFSYRDETLIRFPYNKKDEYWKKYNLNRKLSLKQKINITSSENDIGYQYAVNGLLLQAWLKEHTAGHCKEDIAYACQIISEEVILNELNRVHQKHFKNKSIKVSLAGGVFANVRINQKIYELDFIDNIFVQPAMGDAGLALGAAILADQDYRQESINEIEKYQFKHTYLGPDYSSEVESFLAGLKSKNLSVVRMNNPPIEVARLIAGNKIVGFWHGPMEWGPRALGSRSILLNTFDKDVNDTLNKRLNRTEFMPFAPVVLDYMAKEYFPKYDSKIPAADYMTITYDAEPKYHEILQAVVHVDGTARPQVITKAINPYYYNILDEFYKMSGCGALVNTSFNAHEEPILSTPETAIKALLDNRIDVLILNDFKVEII